MVSIIKKGAGKEEIKNLVNAVSEKGKHLDSSKYSGKLKLKQDPLSIQKKLRNEWN